MKISKSKRILAIFLSILMVISSVPVIAFTAFGAAAVIDQALAEVESAMSEYESKMNGTVYTNMATAYQAYVDCQKAIDAYKYGNTFNDDKSVLADYTNALSGKAAALTEATNNMVQQPWTAYKGTATGTFEYDDSHVSAEDYASVYKNMLYVSRVTTNVTSGDPVSGAAYDGLNEDAGPHGTTIIGGDAGPYTADTRFYFSKDSTMLYDGITKPQLGVMLSMWGNTKPGRYNWNNLRIYYASIGTAQGLSMPEDWHARDNRLNFQYTYWLTSRNCTVSKQYVTFENGMNGGFIANIMQYDRSFNTLMATITNPTFQYCTGYDRGYTDHTGTCNATIHVLNYKMITDAITDTTKTNYLVNVEKYKEGGLTSIINGFDQATRDPNSFFTSSNDWEGCQNHYQTALNNLNSTPVEDDADYSTVRTAMTTQIINTYKNGTNGWTPESWANFKAAYEVAANAMAAPYKNNSAYAAIDGDKIKKDLEDAFTALESNIQYADTTELTDTIETFRSWNNIFTADSYQFALNYVDQAIVAVWGSDEFFGIKTQGPEDTEAGRKLVADQLTLVKDALKYLRISPDASVDTSYGRYSLNGAIAITVENPDEYYNIKDFYAAVQEGNDYKNTLSVTEFTDYNTQYNAYRAAVQKIVQAYHDLAFAFTDIPDGTVVQNSGRTTTQPMNANDKGQQRISYAYTNSAVLIRTSHETKTIPYGTFSITFGTNIQATNNSQKQDNKNTNNGIDAISINATADPISDNFLQAREDGGFLTDRKVPKNLSAEQLETYKADLTYGDFSVGNLYYTGKTSNCDPLYYITENNGNKIKTEEQAKTINLDPILGYLDGTNTGNVVNGSIFAYSSDNNLAFIYIDGELRVNVAPNAPVATELSNRTLPSTWNKRMQGNYIGAVTSYTCRNTVYCAGRAYFSTKTAGDAMDSSVAIVDLSYLIDLVKMCDEIALHESKYTADSFAYFKEMLDAAKTPYPYQNQTASNITNEASDRYVNLWNAYEWLVERPQVLTFNYMDANGQPTTSTVEIPYNSPLMDVKTEIEAINVPNYSLNGSSYTFKGWSPAVNYSTIVTSDLNYTATYDSFATAYWGNYNAAQDKLRNDLANGKFSVEGLESVKAEVDALTYFLYTDNAKLMVSAADQSKIDAEMNKINELDAKLATIALDSSTYDAVVKTVDTLNADAYDVATVKATMDATEAGTPVTIAGVEYTGWNYDFFVKTVIEAMNSNAYEYTVTVFDADYKEYYLLSDGTYTDNPDVAAVFHYGDVVTAVNPVDTAQDCSWEVAIIAQLTNTESVSKYVATASSYQFNVRGNTSLYTSASADEGAYHTITFVDSRNNTMISSITVADGDRLAFRTVTLPAVPFYEVSGYIDRATGTPYRTNGTITNITHDINLTVNYKAVEDVTGYNVILLDANGNELHNSNYNWNTKITLTATGAAGMVDTATGKLVAYGSEYSFYVCDNITLQATDSVDGKVAVSVANPVVSNGNVYFTGSFAKQGFDRLNKDDKSVKGYGIVIDVRGTNKALTLKDVNSKAGIFNLAASALTCGNQFTLFTTAPSGRNVTYRAYVIYDVNGTEAIEYSDVIETTIQ